MLPPSLKTMRALHTSDWHLGRAFKNVGMLGVQARALDQLVEVVRSERIEAVLVSGDVYDRAVPAPDAVGLLSQTLERLVDAGARVVVSSGNHDSATRLGFASALLRPAGVHLATALDDIGRGVEISGVTIYPIPYLEPTVCADHLGATERTHAAVMRAAIARVRSRHRGGPYAVLAHAVVTGGQGCESERELAAGGLSAIPARVFAGAAYVAMGHLHGPQQLTPRVNYSGSPWAMSFGEAAHSKSWTLVDFSTSGEVRLERALVPVDRPLARLRGRLADLLADPRHTAAEAAWCSVVLTDPVRPLGAMDRLRARFPHAIELTFEPAGSVGAPMTYARRVQDRTPLDVCCDFVSHVRGGAGADAAERELLASAVEAARRDRAVREDEGVAAGARTAEAS